MNPRLLPLLRPLRLPAALLGTAVISVRADDTPKPPATPAAKPAEKPAAKPTAPPSETELRAVITKGLGFLVKEGDEWMGKKDCNGCHHMPELLWSHREAKLRGFAIDEKLFEEFVKWSDSHATNISAGREMTALMKLAMPGKPAPELTSLIEDAAAK